MTQDNQKSPTSGNACDGHGHDQAFSNDLPVSPAPDMQHLVAQVASLVMDQLRNMQIPMNMFPGTHSPGSTMAFTPPFGYFPPYISYGHPHTVPPGYGGNNPHKLIPGSAGNSRFASAQATPIIQPQFNGSRPPAPPPPPTVPGTSSGDGQPRHGGGRVHSKIQVKPPPCPSNLTFAGTYLRDMDIFFENLQIHDDRDKLAALQCSLQDGEQRVLCDYVLSLNRQGIFDYPTIVTYLARLLEVPRLTSINILNEQFEALRFDGSTSPPNFTAEFLVHIQRMSEQGLSMSEVLTLEKFLQKLPESIASEIRKRQPDSLHAAIGQFHSVSLVPDLNPAPISMAVNLSLECNRCCGWHETKDCRMPAERLEAKRAQFSRRRKQLAKISNPISLEASDSDDDRQLSNKPMTTMAAVNHFPKDSDRKRAHRTVLFLRRGETTPSVKLMSLLDDGSDISFLRRSACEKLNLEIRPTTGSVGLINAAKIDTKFEATVFVSAEEHEKPVSLRFVVLDDELMAGLNAQVLLGKDTLYTLGRIAIDVPSSSVLLLGESARNKVSDPSIQNLLSASIIHRRSDELCVLDEGEEGYGSARRCMFLRNELQLSIHDEHDGDDLDSTRLCATTEMMQKVETEVNDQRIQIEALVMQNVTLDEMEPIPNALGYFMQLRKLRDDEVRDTEEQVFAFEVSVPDIIPTPSQRPDTLPYNYSSSLISRLDSNQRRLFYEQIQDNIEKHFWSPIPANQLPNDERAFVATVFPVLAKAHKTTAVRPVVDARPINRALVPCYSKSLDWRAPLARLRLLAAQERIETIHILDLRKAYYSLRSQKQFYCRVDDAIYGVNRILFGLNFGPAALQSAMKAFLRLVKKIHGHLDNGSETRLIEDYFDDLVIVASERYVSTLVSVGKLIGFSFKHELLTIAGKEALVLGTTVRLSADGLLMNCPIPKVPSPNALWTKRAVYRIAGEISVDRGFIHAPLRVLADVLRALARGTWDEECLNQREIHSVIEVCDEEIRKLTCRDGHLVVPRPESTVVIHTDASGRSYGYRICVNDQILVNQISLFKLKASHVHSNDLELAAIHGAVKRLYGIVSGSSTRMKTLKVFTDNKAARSWASPTKKLPDGSLRTMRVATKVREFLSALSRHFQTISVEHVAGADNEYADYLSRFIPSTLPGVIVDIESSDESSGSDDVSTVCLTAAMQHQHCSTRFFTGCFTLQQYSRRMRSLITIQRKFQRPPVNGNNNAFHCLVEMAQEDLQRDLSPRLWRKANSSLVGGIWRTNDRNAIVLAANSALSKLIIQDLHRVSHDQKVMLLSRTRAILWCPDIREICKRICDECVFCSVKAAKNEFAKINFKPGFHDPDRLKVLAIVGVDFFRCGRVMGPGNILTKGHVFLCVDKFSRFVTMTPALSQSLDIARNGIDSLIANVGQPRIIRSDQAFSSLSEFCRTRGIELQSNRSAFNPSYGGFYEALVKLCKRYIEATLHKMAPGRYPSWEQCQRAVLIAQRLVNARPLGYKIGPIGLLTPHEVVTGRQPHTAFQLVTAPGEVEPTAESIRAAADEQAHCLLAKEEQMKIVDEYLFETTRNTLISSQSLTIPRDFQVGELLLYKKGIRYLVVSVRGEQSSSQHFLRSGMRKLIDVTDVVSKENLRVDRSTLRRVEVDG